MIARLRRWVALLLLSALRLSAALAAVAELPEPVQIIAQNFAVARSKTVIVNHAIERLNHVVERSRVPATRTVIALQLIQFALGAVKTVSIITAETVT